MVLYYPLVVTQNLSDYLQIWTEGDKINLNEQNCLKRKGCDTDFVNLEHCSKGNSPTLKLQFSYTVHKITSNIDSYWLAVSNWKQISIKVPFDVQRL